MSTKTIPTTIKFDEVEANLLYGAILELIKNRDWNPVIDDEWEELKSYRALLDHLVKFLDGR